MSVMTEDTLAGSSGLWRCCSSAPDKLGYEPVIRSGHYLVLVDGIEPPTPCLQGRRSTC